ncbi:MAG: Golgi mannosyltransferase complex subunit [Chaenotheca gracillima]|nr:MAG: Golgi mannosyltransferase complex subunit [Chaenotheca gracillima]
MIRRPREKGPSAATSELSDILQPLPVSAWGPFALRYLGVPIGVGIHNIVVRDEDYQTAIQKLLNAGLVAADPDRSPPPEVLANLPDPEAAVRKIYKGYQRLDQSATTFKYPSCNAERQEPVFLVPNSFAHLPSWPPGSTSSSTSQYEVKENLFHPLEHALVESFVKAALDAEKDDGINLWGSLLESWITMMVGYLDVNSDALDSCEDHRAAAWFSVQFGRKHEAEHGPWDRRVTKRLGSANEMPVDMRGNPVG